MKTTLYFTLILLTFTTLAFVPNSFAQDDSPEYVVRVIYFYPNDIEPQEDSVNTLRTMVKDVQKFYADEMERHGYGRKTFRLETDENDNVILHHLKGNFDHTRYNDDIRSDNAMDEIKDRLDFSKKIIYLIWVDRYDPNAETGPVKGTAGGESVRGQTWIFPFNFDNGVRWVYRDAWTTIAHEIGHSFGLKHDFRNYTYIMSYGDEHRSKLSACAAKWLDAHKYFNDTVTLINNNTQVRMLLPTLVEPPVTIRLQFKLSDSDGLHQAILNMDHEIGVIECKPLSGDSTTIEFVTPELLPNLRTKIRLMTIDVHGNFSKHNFEVDTSTLLPPSKVVSIPDVNLASVIRETLHLAPHSPITQLNMFTLREILEANGKEITDLTGLEYAKNLSRLHLHDNQISDITPLTTLTELNVLLLFNNQIRTIPSLAKLAKLRILNLSRNPIHDITPLSELTQLPNLYLGGNNISDINPLASLTQLWVLGLWENKISDITPLTTLTQLQDLNLGGNNISNINSLAGLKQLWNLHLWNNQISDIGPLAELTNLRTLRLSGNNLSNVSPLSELVNLRELRLEENPIKDRKSLLDLLEKNPDIKIYLKWGREPLPVNLSHFRAEHTDTGVILKWTTESEVDNAGFYIYRSKTKDGDFKLVTPTMIKGAGTTGERNEYSWTDTTAKPNTVYYYRIEDVSHAGEREQLATVRLKGLVSATGKLTTRWADFKVQQ